MDAPTHITLPELPAAIRSYLNAHAARDTAAAIDAFSPDAVVVDDGRTFHGTDEVRHFLQRAGAEFTYTSELIDARRIDDQHWVVTNHLEGDFPGGVADLAYRFTIDNARIRALTITASPRPARDAPRSTQPSANHQPTRR